ncbi:RcnB family protein [Parasphingopyxis sp.]|uniref:RcnB family protein n=1 Tax=Parasphingopyxis sp. TaxID=1920299 RepID=UPI002636FDD0|nr:RcnB family protein [Parasphingopyxis sp.]
MRSLAFLGLLMSAAMIPGTAQAQTDSGASTNTGVALATQAMRGMRGHRGGTRVWRGGGGHYVRGGGHRFYGHRGGHRFYGHRGGVRFHRGTRFFVGGFLPRYFLTPRYYVVNYPRYGLARPAYGHRWVRYYDDAYLVDGYGRISDTRYGVSYDGRGYYGGDYRYDDRYRDDRYYDDRRYYDDHRRGDGGAAAAGAIAGGIIGGIAGNRIAGRGNRTEGTIIGGALGAIAGGAIGGAAGQSDRYREDRYYRDSRYSDRRHGGHYDERAPVPEYVGNGDYYPPAAPGYTADYDYDYRHDERVVSPPAHHAPSVSTHVTVNGVTTHATQHVPGVTQSATTNIVVHPQPTTTTTTFIEEEVEYVPARRSGHRRVSTRGCNC